ncbi:MAG: response regulator [Pigmentiphaga sp.]|nr:response regulator [Pigmentiphaga sp.]
MHILYVEDNEQLRDTVSALIQEGENRRITCCATAEEALELDARTRFDVVITDVNLPGRSGIELARGLLRTNPSRWIVLCSGHDLGSQPAEWGSRVHTLRKPFDIEALESLLDATQEAGPGLPGSGSSQDRGPGPVVRLTR